MSTDCGQCGIYDAYLDVWESCGTHFARCSVCTATFTHHWRQGVVEVGKAHISASPR